MKSFIALFTLLTFFSHNLLAQDDSPYKTSFAVDAPIIAAGMGLSYWGLTRMQAKDGLTEEEARSLTVNDVNSFDRGGAGNYSLNAKKASDFPFYGSFAMPAVFMLNKNIRSKAGQVAVLYVETMAVTGALFTMTNGSVRRSRPLAYNPNVPIDEKIEANTQNSFYAGHTAATASATFFAAKVFHDFNPDSPARPYVWAVAAAIPGTVGYLRLKAGKHFLSDNILGYVAGATAGILVPQLHKKTNNTNVSIFPVSAPDFNGAAMTYTF